MDKAKELSVEHGLQYTYVTAGGDFNDLHCEIGLEEVLKQFKANLTVEVKPLLLETPKQPSITIPTGYISNEKGLFFELKTGKGDKQKITLIPLYKGTFRPLSIHVNNENSIVSIEIEFSSSQGLKTAIVEQSNLATKTSIIKALTSLGAFINEDSGKNLAVYITRFLEQNFNVMPRHKHTTKLGLHGDQLVLPHITIGGDLQYSGGLQSNFEVLDDNIYSETVKDIFNNWGDEAWPTIMALSYSLSSPLVKKLKLRRNPILHFSGRSGYGKSTVLKFALAAWMEPKNPMITEGSVKNTPHGFFTTIKGLNGLPHFFDETSLSEKIKTAIHWSEAAMAYANGQTRIAGQKSSDDVAKGGETITGCLFGASEVQPPVTVEGVFNRVLNLDTTKCPPIGIEGRDGLKQSKEGSRRAKMLEIATDDGSGVFGAKFIKYVLSDWDKFNSVYQNMITEFDRKFNEHTAIIALCATTLHFLADMLKIENRSLIESFLSNVSSVFADYQKSDNHPAIEALEEIKGLISNSVCNKEHSGDGTEDHSEFFTYRNEPFFIEKYDGIYIPASSPILKQALKTNNLRSFYAKWLEIGAIIPDSHGKPTQVKSFDVTQLTIHSTRYIVFSNQFVNHDTSDLGSEPPAPIPLASPPLASPPLASPPLASPAPPLTQARLTKDVISILTDKPTTVGFISFYIYGNEKDAELKIIKFLKSLVEKNRICCNEKISDRWGHNTVFSLK
jgi:hypothetical protein